MSELYSFQKLTQKQLYTTIALYFVLSLFGIFHHELWLDEAHHWLLARDSISLPDLITNTRSEGHPVLWNLLLFFITRITSNPLWMQILHSITATITVFIFLKNAPFKFFFKLLFVFGYFMLFEYNILSRNYILGVLFLFLALSNYHKRKEKILLITFLLSILCNTHAQFIIISIGLFFIIILEHIINNGIWGEKKLLPALMLFSVGLMLALLQILPPEDHFFLNNANNFSFYERATKSIISFFKGVIIIPDFRIINFWNSNLIININRPIAAILGFVSLIIPIILFFKNRFILSFIFLTVFGGMLFIYVTQIDAIRQNGIYTFIIITALWININYISEKIKFQKYIDSIFTSAFKNKLIYSLFIIQFISGVISYSIDIRHPFTQAKNSIHFLKEEGLDQKIIASKGCDGTALSAYLKHPVFFINTEKMSSYCNWGSHSFHPFRSPKIDIVRSLNKQLSMHSESIIFISYQPIFKIKDIKSWIPLGRNLKYRYLKKFENSIIKKGNYYIYEISSML